MTGLATYALLVVVFGGGPGPSSMTSTPIATQQLCFEAAEEAKKLGRQVNVICVRTS